MTIEHIALWVSNIEESKKIFEEFFAGIAGEKYSNPTKNFESYFISFENGARLEIMQKKGISTKVNEDEMFSGFSHIAFSVGSKEKVNELTQRFRERNFKIVSEPRYTGDGYFESCILELDNNRIEITI